MKKSETQEKLIQSMQAVYNISDAPLNQGQISNFGVIHNLIAFELSWDILHYFKTR